MSGPREVRAARGFPDMVEVLATSRKGLVLARAAAQFGPQDRSALAFQVVPGGSPSSESTAELLFRHEPGEWPWCYEARQFFERFIARVGRFAKRLTQ